MNYRDKILAQAVMSLIIFSAVKTMGMLDIEPVENVLSSAQAKMNVHYTEEKLKERFDYIIQTALNAGDAVTAAVIKANEESEMTFPLGETDENGIRLVYAPAGGRVIMAGISDEHGMYVRIRHDNREALYGNLSDISLLTGERVRKGDIIGSFDSRTEEEFLYEITDPDFSSKISA